MDTIFAQAVNIYVDKARESGLDAEEFGPLSLVQLSMSNTAAGWRRLLGSIKPEYSALIRNGYGETLVMFKGNKGPTKGEDWYLLGIRSVEGAYTAHYKGRSAAEALTELDIAFYNVIDVEHDEEL